MRSRARKAGALVAGAIHLALRRQQPREPRERTGEVWRLAQHWPASDPHRASPSAPSQCGSCSPSGSARPRPRPTAAASTPSRPGSGRTLNGATISLAVPVLEIVQVDLVAALRDVARDRRDVADLAQHDAREQLASVRDCSYVHCRAERHQDVQPRLARGLHVMRQPDLLAQLVQHDARSGSRRGTAPPSDRDR